MSVIEPEGRSASVFTVKSRAKAFLETWPPLILLSLGWVAAMLFVAFFGHLIAPQDFMAMDLRARLEPPVFMGGSWDHALGTDELGRDVLSRLIASIRISLTIAFLSTLIAGFLGVSLGCLAAWARGRTEQAILMLVDAQAAMPFMIIALAVLAFLGNSLTLFTILLGFHGWERIARIARGLAISAQEQGYAAAARDLGASPWRVYGRHILPNIASTLIVSMTLNFPEVILLESGLSFLGLGVQPPLSSLGNMVGYGRDYIQSAPWIMLTPAAAIVLTTLSISMIGDWLRDLFDPTLR
ncbi:MAG: ABC transporter permease [Paracoccaceae bacterium]